MSDEESFVILGSCSQPNSMVSMNGIATLQEGDNKSPNPTAANQPILNEGKFNSITTAIAAASKPTEVSGSNSEQFIGQGVWKRSIDSAKAMETSTQSGSYDVWLKSNLVSKVSGDLQQDGMSVKENPKTGAIPKTNGEEQTAIAAASKPTDVSERNSEQFIGQGVWKRSIDSAKAMETSTQPGSYDVLESIVSKHSGDLQQDDTRVKENPKTVAIPKTNGEEQNEKSETNTKESTTNSMAVSYIMGQVPADALKASIHSQFPSISLEACEDLTTVMADYLKMKDVLIQVNSKMSSWLEMKKQMQSNDMENRQKLQQCQEQIATLRNENLELKRELDTKIEQIHAYEAVRKLEHDELVKKISEKSSLIANMRTQIEKLELQQLSTFEIVSKCGKKEDSEKSEYVTRLEHEGVIKGFERNLSQLLAEKLEITDMQKQYIDEINCLQANLAASESQVNQLQSDIALLKANDKEKTAQFEIYATQRTEMREELDVLRQQVDVYSRDFQLERTAREEMAGEKAQLLDDLRSLQRKNHELSELVGRLEERVTTLTRERSTPPTAATRNIATTAQAPVSTAPAHICPICSITCTSLTNLQEHANQCLDRNLHT
ncbi:NF-kappa-B essential modulator isoform X2 [Zeugodacus cucurbitae]|nr:NF-kappa-B essential modulator isoform X2 [Zeugodacus cucurbitae]